MSATVIIGAIIIVITTALVVSEAMVPKRLALRRTMAKDTFWRGKWLGASD